VFKSYKNDLGFKGFRAWLNSLMNMNKIF